MQDTGTIRSIRIATTLNERFGALVRTAQSVDKVAELELAIGEAQQIYPEIWRHLDEARIALANSGASVDEYDAIRATERPGQLAVSNIESAEMVNPVALAFGGFEMVQFKTATFNKGGHHKAREACNALMRAMPHVDWRAVEREEQAQIDAVGSLEARKWRQLAIAAAIVVALFVLLKALA